MPTPRTIAPRRTLSVIIPAYQAAEWVDGAVRSALAQDPPPLEVIVVDDGSVDQTPAKLAAYGNQITVISQPNRGEAAARNAGVRAATGEYVVFCDADDEYVPGRLEKIHRALDQHPEVDVVTTNASMRLNGAEVRLMFDQSNPFPVTDQRAEILRRNFVFGAAAVRRSRLIEVGGYDESIRFATDWDLWLRLILTGSVVHLVDEPLSLYRLHAESMSNDVRAMSEGQLDLLQRATRNPAATSQDLAVLAVSIADARRELAVAELRHALRQDPHQVRRRSCAVLGHRRLRPRTFLVAFAGVLGPRLTHRIVRRRRADEPRRSQSGIPLD